MRYIIRSIKYFIYFSLLLVVMLTVLRLLHMTGDATDIPSMFKDGYNSLLYIALMFAGVSAIYPLVAFAKMKAIVAGDDAEAAKVVKEYMDGRGYLLEKEDAESMSFRLRSTGGRILKMMEDRIIFERTFSGYVVKGLRKDVVRIIHGVEAKARKE